VQFSKGPLGRHAIGFARLWRDALGAFAILLARAFLALGALSESGKLFSSNEGLWVLLNDLFGERVIRLCL
jgi:hypothetical protein